MIRAKAANLFAGQTVHSIVLEIPDEELLRHTGGAHALGTWAVSILATDAGGRRQIQRAGHPMFHPIFSQHDPDLGDRYNTPARPGPGTVHRPDRRPDRRRGGRLRHGRRRARLR